MKRLLIMAVGAVGFLVATVANADAQSTCRPADWHSEFVINAVTNLVTSSEPKVVATRVAMQIPVVATSKITLVTDSRICTKALAAYNAALGSRGTGATASTSVIVVKVGTDRFVVKDPNQMGGEWAYQVVMDGRYNFLTAQAS